MDTNQSSCYQAMPQIEIEDCDSSSIESIHQQIPSQKFSKKWLEFLSLNTEKKHLSKFIDQQGDFLIVNFNIEKVQPISDIEPNLNKCPDQVFNILLEILQWLSSFNTKDAKLKIQMSVFGETIEVPLMYQIQQSMSQMKNFCVIDIQDFQCEMRNEYAFSLFSSYVVSNIHPQSYYYTLRNTQNNISLKYDNYWSRSEQQCNCIVESITSDHSNFQDLPRYLSKVYNITSQLLTYRECMGSNKTVLNQSNQLLKCINFSIFAPNATFQDQLTSSISFLKIWDLEFSQISHIRVSIEVSSEEKYFMPNGNISEIRNDQNEEFFIQRLLEKCTLFCPQKCKIGLNLLLVLLSRLKALTCWPNTFRNTADSEHRLLTEINRANEKGKPFLIEKLSMKGIQENDANTFIQVVPLLKKLKNLSIHIKAFYQLNMVFLQNLLNLIGHLDLFDLPKYIKFEKQKLFIYVNQFQENFKQGDYSIIKAIESLERPIHLSWVQEFNYNLLFSDNYLRQNKWMFDFLRKILNIKNVTTLNISYNPNINEVYQIASKRLTNFYSITAFRSLVQPEMLFSPAAILLDLYSFD